MGVDPDLRSFAAELTLFWMESWRKVPSLAQEEGCCGERSPAPVRVCAGMQGRIYSLFSSADHQGCLLSAKQVVVFFFSLDNTSCLVATELRQQRCQRH